jgi:hypothetical protein
MRRVRGKKMKNKKMLFVLFFAPSTFASVNMKDASFSKTWIDAEILHRTYASRSLYKGYFGYGWCSNLESRIKSQTENEIIMEDCGTTYTFIHKDKKDFQDITGAKRYIKRMEKYIYFQNDQGEFKKFDQSGRLLEFYNAQGSAMILSYDPVGRLKSLKALSSQARSDSWPSAAPPVWNIHWNDDYTRIEKIQMGSGKAIEYIYNKDDLTEVRENKSSTEYQYDSLHNMIKTQNGKGQKERIVYDANKDQVLEYAREDGCNESFQYHVISDAGEKAKTNENTRHDRSESKIQCGENVQHAQYDFWYQRKTSGKSVLSKVRFITDSGTEELSLKN